MKPLLSCEPRNRLVEGIENVKRGEVGQQESLAHKAERDTGELREEAVVVPAAITDAEASAVESESRHQGQNGGRSFAALRMTRLVAIGRPTRDLSTPRFALRSR